MMLADDGISRSDINSWIEDIVPRDIHTQYIAEAFTEATFEHDQTAVQGGLSNPIWELLDRGGKRWRSMVFVTLVRGFGESPERFKRYACIPELLHSGTLLVDDVEDGATLRRGEPAVHRQYGEDVALNAGNTLYFLPLKILSENSSNLSAESRLRGYEMVIEELTSTHLGQAVDIYWHNDREIRMTEGEYLEMCACKTGSLGRLAARLAPIVVEQSKPVERSLAKWAQNLAVAFQISDDVLDIENTIGNVDGFGKEYGNDIREGKKTLMAIHAANNARPEDVVRLEEILHTEETDRADIEEFVDILRTTESIGFARERAHEFKRAALDHLATVELDDEPARKLVEFTQFSVERSG